MRLDKKFLTRLLGVPEGEIGDIIPDAFAHLVYNPGEEQNVRPRPFLGRTKLKRETQLPVQFEAYCDYCFS